MKYVNKLAMVVATTLTLSFGAVHASEKLSDREKRTYCPALGDYAVNMAMLFANGMSMQDVAPFLREQLLFVDKRLHPIALNISDYLYSNIREGMYLSPYGERDLRVTVNQLCMDRG